jgi:hypothetical protein
VYCKFEPIDQAKRNENYQKLNRSEIIPKKDLLLSDDPNGIDDTGQISQNGQQKTNPEFNLHSTSKKKKRWRN